MVFPEWNKRSKDWYWAAVKAVPITDEEKKNSLTPLTPVNSINLKWI